MAFPLNAKVELELTPGVWTDITSDVYQRDDITITRGRPDETGTAPPSSAKLTLDNRTGNYSPRNPTGVHFGKLGRNTPVRISIPGEKHLWLNGAGNNVSAPDTAGLSVTGDIDVRIEFNLDQEFYVAGSFRELIAKWRTTSDQRSWLMFPSTDDRLLWFSWSTAGTDATVQNRRSTVPIPLTVNGRLALRATLDVNNGASGHDVRFFTAPTLAGPWTQLGDTVTTAGVTSIFDSTAPVEIGEVTQRGFRAPFGRFYEAQIRNGIDGTVVASPDFSAQTIGAGSFNDAQGNTWTLAGTQAEITDRDTRFVGEVASWPQAWDKSGKDAYTQIEVAGITRRLGQGASPLDSALKRGLLRLATPPVAYWPVEDARDATTIASAMPGHPAMTVDGTPTFEASDIFVASKPLPTLGGSKWNGNFPDYLDTGEVQLRFLFHNPAPVAADTRMILLGTTGSAARWNLWISAANGGDMKLVIEDKDAVTLHDTGFVNFNMDGKKLMISLELSQVGADIDWNMLILPEGSSSGSQFSGTLAGKTLGRARGVGVAPNGGLDDDVIGHINVRKEITSLFDLVDEFKAWDGETAAKRLARLTAEESVDFTAVGNPAQSSTTLGVQRPLTLLDLFREVAESDGGLLYEPRRFLGVAYTYREALYAQQPALTLNYAGTDLSSFTPVEDDEHVRNDVTVQRIGGGSARDTDQTGPLGVDMVGRYDDSVSISLSTDAQTADQASWRLLHGTIDLARYPIVGVDMASGSFRASAALTTAAVALDVGDLLAVEGLPAWLPPDDVQQIAQGFTETLRRFQHMIDINCSPEEPWHVGIYGDTRARYSSDGSTLNANITSTTTSIAVATPSGPLWSAADQPFDIYVGGERMTVTAVTGASSPQTFTVTRSVNAVVKAHTAGDEVRLFRRAYYGL